jgi:ABC-type dipeptide/oligopeptide/nickel transport system permease component
MGGLLSSLPALLVVLALLAFLAFATVRVGPRFMVRRLAGLVFVLFGVTFITFIMGYFAPGNAIFAQLGQHYNAVEAARLSHLYGLDLPWYQQYANFVTRLLHFDLGLSYIESSTTVWTILQRFVPTSVTLGVTGVVLAVVAGVPMGILAAVRSGSRTDSALQGIALVLYALPSFVIIPFYEIAMEWLHGQGLPSLATSGWGTPDSMIAPILIFAATSYAYFVRLTRSSLLEEIGKDYVRTARAKGLGERLVIWRHAFRNAILPLLTAIGPALAYSVVGLFIIESLFNIPGIGYETIAAIVQRDFPVVQGTVMLLALAVVFMNLVTDVAYGLADPRIKTQ